MIARSIYRLFLKIFSRRVVRAAYEGILRRSPTPEELAAHAGKLRGGQSLKDLLQDLCAGRTHSGRVGNAEAEHLVRVAFLALLHREPEAEAMAAYTHLLVDTGDIERFLAEVGHSQEHREKLRAAGRRVRALPARA